jgi:hypothetical protein
LVAPARESWDRGLLESSTNASPCAPMSRGNRSFAPLANAPSIPTLRGGRHRHIRDHDSAKRARVYDQLRPIF